MTAAEDPRKENVPLHSADELRRNAEELIAGLADSAANLGSPNDTAAILHELRVHQIELEMQNDQLRTTQLALDGQREKYYELFDLAPVGYLTISGEGIVTDANLSATRLLGVQRQTLVGKPFSAFVLAADRDVYYRHLLTLQEAGATQPFELRLQHLGRETGEGTGPDHFWALLEGKPQPGTGGEDTVFWVTFTDIAGRRLAEEALRVSTERLRQLVESAHDFIWEVDENGAYTFVSSQVTNILGYEPAEMIGRVPFDFMPTEEAAQAALQFGALVSELAPFRDLENVNRHKGGHLVVLETNGVPFFDAVGALAGYRGTDRNITSRVEAEAALREGEQLLQESQRIARVGHYVLDFRTGMWTSSAELDDIYGIDESFVRNVENWLQVIHPDERDAMLDSFQAEAGGEKREFDTVHRIIRVADGTELIVHGRGVVEVDDEGEPVRMFGVIQDITERQAADEELRIGAERYQTLLQTAMDGFSLIDTEGRLLEVNEAYVKMCGYSADELLGMRIQDLVPPGNANDMNGHMKTILAEGCDRFESRHLRKDGTVFDIELSVHYRPADEGRMAAFIRDISERNQTDRLLALQSELLNDLASQSTADSAIGGIVEAIQRATGLDAVGLRLPQDDEYPFLASVGYANDFLKTENVLTVSYPDGGLCRNDDGSVMLECTCGLVLRGDFEPTDPLFTPGGSVWTNDSAPFLELPPEQDPRLHPRNKCVHVGFQSIALIPLRAGNEIFGLLHMADRRKDRFTPDSIRFFEGVCSSLGTALRRMHAEEEIVRQNVRITQMLASVIQIAGSIAEARDPYTAGHQRRVSEIAVRISQDMGMTPEQIEDVRVAALIHDVGKMSVPAEILSKPGKLSAIEFGLIKGHAEAGYQIIAAAHMEGPTAEIVYQHHERCDGSGYPRGLSADELLPEGKVLMVADVVEAMMSHRPYRASLGIDAAMAEIERGAGTLFDTNVVESCLRIVREHGFEFSEV